MGPSYFQTVGFQRDREQLFRRIDRLTAAIERVADALEIKPPVDLHVGRLDSLIDTDLAIADAEDEGT